MNEAAVLATSAATLGVDLKTRSMQLVAKKVRRKKCDVRLSLTGPREELHDDWCAAWTRPRAQCHWKSNLTARKEYGQSEESRQAATSATKRMVGLALNESQLRDHSEEEEAVLHQSVRQRQDGQVEGKTNVVTSTDMSRIGDACMKEQERGLRRCTQANSMIVEDYHDDE